ncbi:MAG: formylglycine-generating enzyme family protein, partial [Verrucomicrobiota bacterium]
YDLPTEAQWEYACRAGTSSSYSFGDSCRGRLANCAGNHPHGTIFRGPYLERTTVVGTYPSNPWGFFDMHGNVWEWCRDWKADYADGPVTDPVRIEAGGYRVNRGGGWFSKARLCRSALRNQNAPDFTSEYIGFRLALTQRFDP